MNRRDPLLLLTFAYLLLPNVLFVASWLKLVWALPATLLLLVGGALLLLEQPAVHSPALSRCGWIALGVATVFWVLASGIGEFTYQNLDYEKHNHIFHALITHSWPVRLPCGTGEPPFLCYYVAYYLPTSLAGKILGFEAARWASAIWAGIGIGLSWRWLLRLDRHQRPVMLLVLFLLWGGADVFKSIVKAWQTDGWRYLLLSEEESVMLADYTIRLLYHGNITQLTWTPQHTIGGWLVGGVLLYAIEQPRYLRYAWALHACLLLWSPFVWLGFGPYLLWHAWRQQFRPCFSAINLLVAVPLSAIMGFYYLAHAPQEFSHWVLPHIQSVTDVAKAVYYLASTVLVYWLPTAWLLKHYPDWSTPALREWLRLSGICLLLIPLYRMGWCNDFMMRVAMPSMMVLSVLSLQALIPVLTQQLWKKHRTALLLVVVYTVGTYVPLKHHVRWLYQETLFGRCVSNSIANTGRYPTLCELEDPENNFDLAAQYQGQTSSFFGRYLMRQQSTP